MIAAPVLGHVYTAVTPVDIQVILAICGGSVLEISANGEIHEYSAAFMKRYECSATGG